MYEQFPDKFLLATEACNCPGVKIGDWDRGITKLPANICVLGESYAKDIIQDLNNFASGWVDW